MFPFKVIVYTSVAQRAREHNIAQFFISSLNFPYPPPTPFKCLTGRSLVQFFPSWNQLRTEGKKPSSCEVEKPNITWCVERIWIQCEGTNVCMQVLLSLHFFKNPTYILLPNSATELECVLKYGFMFLWPLQKLESLKFWKYHFWNISVCNIQKLHTCKPVIYGIKKS